MSIKLQRTIAVIIGFLLIGVSWSILDLTKRIIHELISKEGMSSVNLIGSTTTAFLFFGCLACFAAYMGLSLFRYLGQGRPLPIKHFVNCGGTITVLEVCNCYIEDDTVVMAYAECKKPKLTIVKVPKEFLPKGGLRPDCKYVFAKNGLVFAG